jgi:chromate transporter
MLALPDAAEGRPPAAAQAALPFRSALALWWRIGWISFGGPAAHIAILHRELVEKRALIDEGRFLRALNFCMLLPGPEAQQLATYLGWLLHGVRGGLAAGILFVVPGALVMALLSILYVELGDLAAVAGLFFGLKAAVLALVVMALRRIAGRALRRRGAKALALCAFVALFALDLPFPLVLAAAGLWGALTSRGGPRSDAPAARTAAEVQAARGARRAAAWALLLWLLPLVGLPLALGPEHVLAEEARFFSGAAMVTFGGAYAVLSYISSAAVERFQWLTTP